MVKIIIQIILLYETIFFYNWHCFSSEIDKAQNISKIQSRTVDVDTETFILEDIRKLPPISTYNQVLTHYITPFGDQYGRSTNVHETVHDINSSLSNTKSGYRAVYIGGNRAAWLRKPQTTMTDTIPYISPELRNYRFKTYFVDSIKYWNDNPLYPFDEWSAYIAGAECAVDDFRNNIIEKNKEDSVSGALEFSIYCIATAMAIKNKDKEYWSEYLQFKKITKLMLIKSEKIFFEGREMFPSAKQDVLLYNLRNSKQTKYFRDFIYAEFDGIFLENNF